MEWSWCGSTLFSPSQFLVLWSYNISSPPPSPWQRHIAFFPSSFFKVTFSPSHSSLWAIGTICHYLWSWRHVFFSCLQPNPTISSSFLTSPPPPISSPFKHTVTDTTGVPSNLSLSVCFCVFIRLFTPLLWCCVSLPRRQQSRPRAHVSQFRGHPAPTSHLTHWLHQLTYGAHIWASSIRDGWPEGASAETKPVHRRLAHC